MKTTELDEMIVVILTTGLAQKYKLRLYCKNMPKYETLMKFEFIFGNLRIQAIPLLEYQSIGSFHSTDYKNQILLTTTCMSMVAAA